MLGSMSGVSPADAAGIYALLAVLADPGKARQALDEIVAQVQANTAVLADLTTARADVEKKRAEVEELRNAAVAARAEAADIAAKAERDIAAREALLQTGEVELRAAQQRNSAATEEILRLRQDAEQQGARAALAAAEAEKERVLAATAHAEAATLRNELETRIERIKQAAGA